jgi:hypothetical protein
VNGVKKRKSRGIKQRIREEKKHEERIGLAILVVILIVVAFISGFLIKSMLNQPLITSTSEPKAAIVDHLSLTAPNQTFIETATRILKQAGYTVDYYSGEKVTVEFYRNLPTKGYKIIILRVHSTATNPDRTEGPVTLFTSERANPTIYVYEQLTDQLVGVEYSEEKGTTYFGITPLFVTKSMKGNFQNSIIIMMGCEGLDNPLMAMAFIKKGAKVYISWNGLVSASHTDTTTIHTLQQLLNEKKPIKDAIEKTMEEVGPDTAYKSKLLYWPSKAGNYTVQNILGSIAVNTGKIVVTQNVLGRRKRYITYQ